MSRFRLLLAVALLLPRLPADAAVPPGLVAVSASGSFSPGIPVAGCADQVFGFSGTAVLAGEQPGVYSFSFVGTSLCESMVTGQGQGALFGDLEGTLAYSRTGNVAAVSGEVKPTGGTAKQIAAATCIVVVTSFNPVAGVAMFCAWMLLD